MINLKTTLSAFALAAAMAATSAIGAFAQSKPTVGIAMPTKSKGLVLLGAVCLDVYNQRR